MSESRGGSDDIGESEKDRLYREQYAEAERARQAKKRAIADAKRVRPDPESDTSDTGVGLTIKPEKHTRKKKRRDSSIDTEARSNRPSSHGGVDREDGEVMNSGSGMDSRHASGSREMSETRDRRRDSRDRDYPRRYDGRDRDRDTRRGNDRDGRDRDTSRDRDTRRGNDRDGRDRDTSRDGRGGDRDHRYRSDRRGDGRGGSGSRYDDKRDNRYRERDRTSYRDLDDPRESDAARPRPKAKHSSGLLDMLKEQILKEAQASAAQAAASEVHAESRVSPMPQEPQYSGAPSDIHSNVARDDDPVAMHSDSSPTVSPRNGPAAGEHGPTTQGIGGTVAALEPDVPAAPEDTGISEATRIAALLNGCRHVDHFKKLNRIAEGTYGVVYRAQNKETGEIVALKKVKLEHESEGFPIVFIREMKILTSLDHVNVLTANEIVVGNHLDAIFIVMPYMDHDVKYLMDCMRQPFQQNEVKCLMLQLLEGIKYMHDHWVLHRDLKPSNLLINHSGILKIADLGLAREYGSPLNQYTPLVVTLWYRAPELLLEAGVYSSAVDMWSVGCIFAELLNKEPLITGMSELEQVGKIFELLGTPTDESWPGFTDLPLVKKLSLRRRSSQNLRSKLPFLSESGHDLLRGLLTYDPAKRLTADEALDHPYFQETPRAIDPSLIPTHPERHENREKDAAQEQERELRNELLGNQRGSQIPGVGDANVGPGRGFTLRLG